MNTKNSKSADVQPLATATKDGYKVSLPTAKLLDCLQAGQNYYAMIADAVQEKYGAIMTDDEINAKARPYLDALNDIADMLHEEITGSIIDAMSDTKNTAADCIQI